MSYVSINTANTPKRTENTFLQRNEPARFGSPESHTWPRGCTAKKARAHRNPQPTKNLHPPPPPPPTPNPQTKNPQNPPPTKNPPPPPPPRPLQSTNGTSLITARPAAFFHSHFFASFSESKKTVCLLRGPASSMCKDSRSLAARRSSADRRVETYPRSCVFNICSFMK